ncbi:GntR family transcriptional regulator [Streptomyces malaysiensis]|uniref:GntR family transcriptional regulator n=1 Tax=Streptomyces malaysiensis TaxID=92644 RepID=UPI0008531D3F|nr:GntR family transcriptional regulator [Streptomyces sp. SPMA113]
MAKWKELAERLAEEIRNGSRPPGSTLPHIPELVAAGEGSKATVHKAYTQLEAWGYVASRRGRGTTVLDRSRPRVTLNRYERILSPATTRGPWESATAAEPLDAPPEVAELLGLPVGASVVCCRYRATLGTGAVALREDWYPLDVARAAGLDRPEQDAVSTLGSLVDAGILPAEAEESITVDTATPDQAAELALRPYSTVLLVDRITRDETGRAIELARLVGASHRLRLVYSPLPLAVCGRHEDQAANS